MEVESVLLSVVVLCGWCVHMSPLPIFGGSLAASSSSSWLESAVALFLLDFDFFFFFRGDEELIGGGLCKMKRVRSSPGRTARGGGWKADAPSGGGGRLVGAGGRAAIADMALVDVMCRRLWLILLGRKKELGRGWLALRRHGRLYL